MYVSLQRLNNTMSSPVSSSSGKLGKLQICHLMLTDTKRSMITVDMSPPTMVSSCNVCSPAGLLSTSSESIRSMTCKHDASLSSSKSGKDVQQLALSYHPTSLKDE